MAIQAKTVQGGISQSTVCTTAELAVVLGLTSRRIRQLADEGILMTVKKNAYPLAECVQSYIEFLKKAIPSDDDVKLELEKKKAEVTLKKSKASIAKMQAEELKGTMHRSEDVAAITEDLIYSIRAGLLSLPGRLSVNVAAAASAAEASDIITKEVHAVMLDIANHEYDPTAYEARVRERMAWNAQQEEEQNDE